MKVEGISLPKLKLYYKPKVIKIEWYWNKGRLSRQWVRTEYLTTNFKVHAQQVFDK